jgi:branched-chain amino acid transport system substrate-binding protein
MTSPKLDRRSVLTASLALGATLVAGRAGAQSTPKEIKLGQTMPYSGPASAYGTIGKVELAYFKKINDEQGGVNGRKINLISVDDGYSPPKAVEQVRKLVEQDEVLALFQTLGTPSNSAIHKYVNAKKVPHLFVATGATKWNDPKNYPWTFGFNLSYQTEGQIYAKYLLKNKPNAKIAILYQNDDYGKDVLKGVKDVLTGAKAKMIIAEATYEVTDPTVDSQILTLKASGADTFINITTPKFAAQAVRKVYDSGWKPLHLLNNVGASVGSVLTPAGLEKSIDIVTVQYYKDATDPQWKDDPAMLEWRGFMAKYYREGNVEDASNIYGYIAAQTMVQVLKQCGNNLSRDNIKTQAESLKNFRPPLLLPGVALNTSPTDHAPVDQAQLSKFNGKQWVLFGEVLGASN